MNKITSIVTAFSKVVMNMKLCLMLLFFATAYQASAQSNGIYESYAILSLNGGANSYYDLNATTSNPDFQGANLGSFTSSNALVVKGGQNKTFKCSGGDITGGNLYYRVWLTNAGASGSFSGIGMGFLSNDAGGCGGNQTWQGTSGSTNILSGITTSGNYTLEVYSDAPGFPSTAFSSNGGSNYKATFNFCGPTTGALQVGNYSIPGCFSSVASAVTYLNANGVTGSGIVQFDVAAGYTETAPATGILLSGLATGSATTQIVFKKNGSGANPTISAPLWAAGGLTNGIIKIIGGDYITFDGFTIQENPGNTVTATGTTNTMTEIGIGMYLASATNGAQNNTIQNCTISLNSTFPNSIGIFSSSSSSASNGVLAATATSGTNSNNKIYGNTISNVAYGFYSICEPINPTLNESGWDIGGTSAATGNTINYGATLVSTNAFTRFNTALSGGIVFRYGAGMNVRYNSITSNPIIYVPATLTGIAISSNLAPSGVAFNTTISNNIINLTNNGSTGITAIDFGHGNLLASFAANNNAISIVCGFFNSTGGIFQGIRANYASNNATYSNNSIDINQSGTGTFAGAIYFINADGATNSLTVQSNILQSVGSHLKTSGQVFGISHSAAIANSLTIGGSPATANTINYSRTGIGTGVSPVYGVYSAGTSGTTTNYTIDYNNITISGVAGTSQSFGITNIDGGAATNKTFNYNTINLSGVNSGVSNGMFLSKGIITASNNSITVATAALSMAGIDFTINGTVTSANASNNSITLSSTGVSPAIRGINTSLTSVINEMIFRNNVINSISASASTGNPVIHGIRMSVGTNNIISGNTIKNFTTGASSGNATLSGISIFGGTNPSVFNNNINSIESSCSGSLSSVSGISIALTTTTIDIYNNLISELRAPSLSASTGIVGVACYATNSTYRVYHNTIKLGNATPISGGTNFGALGVGLAGNDASTILDLRNNIINLNVTASGNGFASCVGINSGVANTAPLGFATTSNNNIYNINSGANNYLFVQGADTSSPLVNGFAVSGLTANTANNINNDTNFNATCGLYKLFLGTSSESATHTEDNLVAGVPLGVYAPSGLSFAENSAQTITSPAIATDFNGISRTPTNDIGAVQFSGTTNVFVSPTYPASVTINVVPTGTICAGTSVTFTAAPVNGGTTPTYQWQINGVPVSGQNAVTFTSTTIANNDVVTVVMTSNLPCVIDSPATSNGITMSVNPILTASVSIAASATTICSGTSVTFTATPTNGGASPSYQWYVDATPVGTNSSTYTTTSLVNSDSVSVVLTSNATPCLAGSPATSNSITISVNPILTASVSIVASATTICAGTSITFTATPTNGGLTPSYQWYVGATPVGTDSATYATTSLANADSVSVVLTSSATPCLAGSPATSNSISITVNPILTASVSIAASATTICSGTSVTFTATSTNGGPTPSYQWYVGATPVGTDSATFTSSTLTNGNSVSVVLTSNATPCLTGSPATSNSISITVNPILTASVSIAASATTICAGTSVTFTATPTNGGASPSYQWYVGATPVGTNSATFTSSTLTNGNSVSVVMSSNATPCLTGSPATSNSISITVNPILTASVSIVASATTICAGTSVTFTATPTNGGPTPSYQWYVGATPVGTNNATFTATTLANTNLLTVVMTSNLPCVINSPATSNGITMSVNPNTTYYQDLDADGFGNPSVTQTACFGIPVGYVANNLDCNDNQLQYLDSDGDGFGVPTLVACGVANTTDCNDANPAMNTTYTFYTDADGDGFGSALALPQLYCAVNATTPPTPGLSPNNTDCDDTKSNVKPGAVDICYDGIDNDCNGNIDNVGLPGGCIPKVGNLQSPSCGATVPLLTTTVSAINIPGAQAFRFKITNMTTNVVQIYDSPSISFQFISIAGVTFATQYKVEVAVKFGGVWQGFYGTPCFVYTPSPTSVISTQCGTTVTSFSQIVNVNYVANISMYRFEITNQSNGQTQYVFSNQNKFTLSQLAASNQTFATNYFVRVALRNTDGTYLPEGAGCIIRSQAYPTTQVRTLQCNNYNVPNNTESIFADANPSATSYRFRLFNGSYDAFYDATTNKFSLSNFSGLASSTTYSVQVAITLPNNPIGPYGKICSIRTPAIAKAATNAVAFDSNNSFEVVAYPNPFAANFKLDVFTNDVQNLTIRVYDMLGKLVEVKEVIPTDVETLEVGANYSSGVYNVIVTQGENSKTQRIIKR